MICEKIVDMRNDLFTLRTAYESALSLEFTCVGPSDCHSFEIVLLPLLVRRMSSQPFRNGEDGVRTLCWRWLCPDFELERHYRSGASAP
jgi:hypothetical protein